MTSDDVFLVLVSVLVAAGVVGLYAYGTVDQSREIPAQRRRRRPVPAWLVWSVALALGVAVAWALLV